MSRYLRHVVTWPWTGSTNDSWAGHDGATPDLPAYDAFARIMPRVSEAYSVALFAHKVPNRVAEVRLVPIALCDGDMVIVSPVAEHPPASEFEIVHVTLPESFGRASGEARAQTGLATIDAAVHALAGFRGWSTQALNQASHETMAGGIQCMDMSPWKMSPGRHFTARVRCWIHDDGFVRASLEVADRNRRPILASADQITWGSMLSHMRAIRKGFRWVGSSVVVLDEPLGPNSVVTATVDGRSGIGTVEYVGCEVGQWEAPPVQRDQAFPVHIDRSDTVPL